ncbi:ABC transporter ATP-binding protein [Clostridium sporogenes]|uniref:ABC transporter ATP-binding protein n=1 Tax=Clostridium botulinum TaxID=1491 RepID=A0A2P1TMG4_CLOBO|nr:MULTISPECIES: ABC transporter ATP-binding protein [Clostridium]AVP66107.1 ABC transporter ATP-binding protein [Clostridium botulinum]AVQ46832.1 ABC transporter ATP-binding protein [Clostridium botulinum]AVQ50319.1 ABC transporter ATP-binding protein [Clostridium botulinum]EHN16970.1 ABC transporter, ATP-binding protein [Clostridium sporogenes PA 3679]KOY67933.1 spermidine/putrescine ABC transporter ATP-binding protein [Clostridium sporogenes]
MDKVIVENIFMNYHSLKGSTPALKDISFSIEEGEFVSIVGPSGCGKSTLLNIIAGLIPQSSGDIYIDGEKQKSISPKIGYMFQKDHLFNWLTVLDNITLGLKIQHKLNSERKETIEKLLKDYGLLDFKDHHPDELSGGMRQKVALIRTLALNPEVLLLDEPFSALDYQTRLNISDEIYNIIKKEGKTAIMVTHDISEAVAMSDRILVLSKRPAKIKKDVTIKLSTKCNSPLKCREAPEFRVYFNDIWKELNDI